MSQTSIRLVCFDLGGVVLRICRSWREACAAANLHVRGPHHLLEAQNGWYVPYEIFGLYQTGQIECDEYFRRVSEAIDHRYSPNEIAAVHDAWLLGEYEGVGKLISQIHAAGVETAALSNTNHAHWIRMSEFPAVMKLNHRLASHILGLNKPDRAIYHACERQLGRRAEEVLFFDDLSENVEAARSVGWNAVLIDPHSPTDVQIERALLDAGVLNGE